MGLMYNSLCVLTHPQWPWGSPQCITVKAELHSAVARGVLPCKNPHAHTLEHCLRNHKIYVHTKPKKQPILHKSCMRHSHYTQIHVHKRCPITPTQNSSHSTDQYSDWPCMSLAVTGTLWYERDPIDPRPTSPSSSKGHHSITIDPLCVSDCVCVCEGERWRGVWANEAQPAED